MSSKRKPIEQRHDFQVIDLAIRKMYQSTPYLGQVKDFCHRHDIPRHQVRRWALRIGVATSTRRAPAWSDREMDLLEENYFRSTLAIRKILRKENFIRSETSIMSKRKRMGLRVAGGGDAYSAQSLAEIMGIDGKVVMRWINRGWLKAEKKGTERVHGGDITIIEHGDVRAFIVENVAVVDIRKIDKFWLIDLLANK